MNKSIEQMELATCLYQNNDFEYLEKLNKIKNYIETLEESKQEIIKLYFGFYNGKTYSEKEIAKMLGVYYYFTISRIINNIINDIKKQLFPKKNNATISKTLYDYFKDFTKVEVEDALIDLTELEIRLLKLKYGNDFESPTNNFPKEYIKK